jgi:5'-3' exonuclease
VEGPWLLAVDGTGLFVRCHRGTRAAGLTAPDGTPTGALTAFAGSLSAVVRELSPQYMVIAWDGGNGSGWRREIAPGYKRNRIPEDIRWDGRPVRAFDAVREFCNAARIAQWCLDDFEADDLLAAAVRLSARDLPGVRVMLLSEDKDMLQLTEPGRVWARPLGVLEKPISAREVELTWGVKPGFLPRLRALAGDRSDGIPGVHGIGPVVALRMLTLSSGKWPLPPEILRREDGEQALAWSRVMDLNDPPRKPEDEDLTALAETGILDMPRTAWERGNVLPVLKKYGMRKMADRYSEGSFW